MCRCNMSARSLLCSHTYHEECLDAYMKATGIACVDDIKCPVCFQTASDIQAMAQRESAPPLPENSNGDGLEDAGHILDGNESEIMDASTIAPGTPRDLESSLEAHAAATPSPIINYGRCYFDKNTGKFQLKEQHRPVVRTCIYVWRISDTTATCNRHAWVYDTCTTCDRHVRICIRGGNAAVFA